jgi:hypothetical protein
MHVGALGAYKHHQNGIPQALQIQLVHLFVLRQHPLAFRFSPAQLRPSGLRAGVAVLLDERDLRLQLWVTRCGFLEVGNETCDD